MRSLILATIVLLFGLSLPVHAGESSGLLMMRSNHGFEETLERLEAALSFHEYKVSRIQRVDVGMTKSGYKTDKYRLVFFANPKELAELTARHPELAPFLPLKMVIFAEGDETLLLVMDPIQLKTFYPDKGLDKIVKRWSRDVQAVLHDTTGH